MLAVVSENRGSTLKVDIAARCPSSIVESKYGDTGIIQFSNCKKPSTVLLPLYGAQEQPRELVKQIISPHLRESDSVGLGWYRKICISDDHF